MTPTVEELLEKVREDEEREARRRAAIVPHVRRVSPWMDRRTRERLRSSTGSDGQVTLCGAPVTEKDWGARDVALALRRRPGKLDGVCEACVEAVRSRQS